MNKKTNLGSWNIQGPTKASLKAFGKALAVPTVMWAVATMSPVYAAEEAPEVDSRATVINHDADVFGADPIAELSPYDSEKQLFIYGGKELVTTPRPLLELGRRQYEVGPFREGINFAGSRNLLFPGLSIFGDWRTAVAYNDNGGKEQGLLATRLNLDVDLKLTGTERIHAFLRPLDQGGKFTRWEFSADDEDDELILDGNLETLFFEGDMGSIIGGITGRPSPADIPFAVGLMPLLLQNGVWLEDAFNGVAVTIPARNSKLLDISNFDVTFFAAFDDVTSLGVRDRAGDVAEHNVNVYGGAAFVEARGAYWEFGYAFTDGREGILDEQDYHNISLAYSRRVRNWFSASLRGVWNFGQDRDSGLQQNADGGIILLETSLITSKPLTLIPYMNLFVGLDRPQSLARDNGGILKNTGINFETDALTGFPKLDDTGHDAFGGAIGVNYLFNLDQQIVVEVASVQVLGGTNVAGRAAVDDEYALGVRYQRPLSKAWIVRTDAIIGERDERDDLLGVRLELRRKF